MQKLYGAVHFLENVPILIQKTRNHVAKNDSLLVMHRIILPYFGGRKMTSSYVQNAVLLCERALVSRFSNI